MPSVRAAMLTEGTDGAGLDVVVIVDDVEASPIGVIVIVVEGLDEADVVEEDELMVDGVVEEDVVVDVVTVTEVSTSPFREVLDEEVVVEAETVEGAGEDIPGEDMVLVLTSTDSGLGVD